MEKIDLFYGLITGQGSILFLYFLGLYLVGGTMGILVFLWFLYWLVQVMIFFVVIWRKYREKSESKLRTKW